jgi:hypothetical protein
VSKGPRLPVIAGIAGGLALLFLFVMMTNAYSAQQTKMEYSSRFANYGTSETINLSDGLVARNVTSDPDVARLEQVLKSCEHSRILMGYGLGSMQIAIGGQEDKSCIMAVMYEIEMGATYLDCTVPLDRMEDWTSWKNTNLSSVSEISAYCKELKW